MERRRHTRHSAQLDANLQFSTLLIDAKPTGGMRRMLAVAGTTRDLSESGLALVVPQGQIGEQYLALEDCTLQIMLELPDRVIEIEARLVRHEKAGGGYLIGAEITKISEEDRAAYLTFLSSL